MRLGVLDIGSNTGHLLVVDAAGGAAPLPAYSFKEPLRLAEHLDDDGAMTQKGIAALVDFVGSALDVAESKGCEDMYAFATSATRDSANSDEVLDAVKDETGVELEVLPGDDEARLTFLAVRRWFGWSSGRLLVFDIGGGSLEIATGQDENPDVVQSLPLGAGRLTRGLLTEDPPEAKTVRKLRKSIRADLAREAGKVLRAGEPQHAVATSKTFRSLARICGAAPSGEGMFVRRTLSAETLREKLDDLLAMDDDARQELPGVSPRRSRQLVAGALVADAVMDIFGVEELEICPWALREGVILERLDELSILG
ncbi:Ppx/GppA family phosphatase [Nocardioides sp. HDW12B]|uniref:Ppx/GppA phosphatase family protein n=1 Tax=Nocardioides sp. HDW12B TaxID=2714939 RepID=UPI00140B968F|nr:Ppx/GppA phosphatase family protein [Nocardioides sp. HDW12B]QIK65116.1 Ppx/GppA family phosphatase [Nocardioides sp. HDW12B]